MLAYALRRCPSEADAQDLLADTFLVAWRRLDSVPDGEATRLWLYAVARRMLANHRRGRQRRLNLAERLEEVYSEPPFRDTELAREDVSEVLRALSRLRPLDQEVLRLAAWEGLSHTEIGVVLGCSPNASAIRLHRARRRLAEAFQKETNARRTQTIKGSGDAKRGRHARRA